MQAVLSIAARLAAAAIGAVTLALLLSATATADEHRDRRHEAGEPYRAQHWIYDDRYHHGHYYPTIGYSVGALPPGYIALNFSNRRLFFQGGVWFAPAGTGYAVVRPPVGVVVPMLPPAYATVRIAGVPYYYANDIYYTAVPGGYAVSAAPAATAYTEMPPAAAPPAQAPQAPPASSVVSSAISAPQAAGGMWYYCEASRAYYPYVAECKEGWRPVPAIPPQPRQ